ncbi:MAG TPA: serine/threonine-protein kinase [Gemmatimonadaceae bacterium]|nr:serine/threonine-protein kinase [Gemmatimonadaceae bacterium]
MTGEKVCPQCGVVYPASARFCETDGSALRLPEQGSDLVGSVVADRYHVIAKLGEGGMGQVYLAEHVKMGRKSALKVMRPSLVKDVDAITRFNREAANASRISHPNVAAVYDFGETPDGLIYLAMELVDGRPLSALLAEKHCLTPARAAEIVRQTADALAAAHDLGIVHRDLKPDNIMLARGRDGADLVKVVDFGIAKVADSDAQKVTKTGSIIGTPEYMSPEQLAGDPLDARSDVYALGLVAFAMLTGTLPFPSDSAQEALIMRLTERPRTLAMAQPGAPWPAAVQTALDGALERDASRRYQSAVDFARALGHATAEMSGDVDQLGVTRPMTAVQFAPTAQPLPATRLSGGVARGAAVSSSRQTSRVSMLGGIAAIVVLGGLGYALTRGRTADPSTSPSNADRMSRTLPPIPDTGAPAGKSANPISTVAVVPHGASQGASTAAPPVVDVDRLLDSLEERAKADKPAAREVLRRLSTLAPTLVASGDSVHAALARFDAMLTLEDAPGACRALVAVRDHAAGTSYQQRVDGKLEACP